jgi:YaiO family outer membrane protein
MSTPASRLLLALALASSPWAAHGSPADGDPRRQATLSARWEHPDQGLDDWHAVRFEVASTPGNWQRAWHLAVLSERRFGGSDQGVEGGAVLPLDARWLLQVDAGLAPDAGFLPRAMGEVALVRRFGRGVLATMSARHARYRTEDADRIAASVERYAGDWRLAWTSGLTRVGGAASPGHDIAVDRYYGDRNSIGARLGRGSESVPLPGGVRQLSRTRWATVQGRHWVAPRWGVQWAAGYVQQAGLYDRAWVQLGGLHAW